MAINRDFITKLTDSADIIDVVSKYVGLKKQGRNYTGLCPFHSEKTPSFVVSPEKQLFKCFGCSAGGNVLGFIMKCEGLEYPDAIRFLAKSLNMDVPEDDYDRKESQIRNRILQINNETAKFFYQNLINEKNAHIQKYLADRNIGKKTATVFGIGYANKSFNDLQNYLTKKGFSLDEQVKAGVMSKNDKGNIYDKFRARVMFPIIDIRGNIIGFGGRVTDNSLPKYLNSPDTPVFNKSNNLFGLNIAKKTKADYIILCEGYMDVIALHKAGFDSAVASLGTALTDAHARLLLRHTKNVIIAYDADNAGLQATNRAIETLKKVDLNVKVLQMNGAKDPDEYIQNFGKDAFLKLLEGSTKDNDYKFANILNKFNLEDSNHKLECVREVVKFIASIPSPIERELYVIKIHEITKISKESIINEVKRFLKREKTKQLKPVSIPTVAKPKFSGVDIVDLKSSKAEEEIIALIFTDKDLIGKIDLDENRFSVEVLKKIYIHSKKLAQENTQVAINDFYEILNTNEIDYLSGILSNDVNKMTKDIAISDYIKVINTQFAIRTQNFVLLQQLRRNENG